MDTFALNCHPVVCSVAAACSLLVVCVCMCGGKRKAARLLVQTELDELIGQIRREHREEDSKSKSTRSTSTKSPAKLPPSPKKPQQQIQHQSPAKTPCSRMAPDKSTTSVKQHPAFAKIVNPFTKIVQEQAEEDMKKEKEISETAEKGRETWDTYLENLHGNEEFPTPKPPSDDQSEIKDQDKIKADESNSTTNMPTDEQTVQKKSDSDT